MERLGAMDVGFIDIEESGPPVAIGNVMRVEGKAPTVAQLRKFFESRLPSMPRFRQKFEPSRSKVLRGKWVDATPDFTHHITHTTLKRGDSVDALVSSIMEQPLDYARPLWDVTQVTGYAPGEWSIILRLHHAIADGQGATILLGQLIDLDPTGAVRMSDGIAAMVSPRESDPSDVPTDGLEAAVESAAHAVEKAFRITGQFISTLPDTVRSALMFMPQRRSGSLTGEITAKRLWHSSTYSLEDVKVAKRSLKGVTVNDIVMAAVAEGFTELLQSRGEDTDGRVLRAVIPVSLRRNMDANNQVGLLPVPLPLGGMDPLKRIRAIKKSTKYSKNSTLPIIGDQVLQATQGVLPAPLQEAVLSKAVSTTDYFSETLVTNVPGPRVPLYLMGEEIVGSAPVIPIEGHFRIIIGITSFKDDLNIGITGDGEFAADIDVLADGIAKGFDKIVAAAAEKKRNAKHKEIQSAVAAASRRQAKESKAQN